MGQSSLGFNADGADDYAEPGANPLPAEAQDRDSSSIQSPDFQLTAPNNPAADAIHSADATLADASPGNFAAIDPQSNPSGQSDPSQDSPSAQTPQSLLAPGAQSTAPDTSTSLTQPAASTAATPRQRQPPKQIGQLPDIDQPQPDWGEGDWRQMGDQLRAWQQQYAQINQSDPYISNDDGRWKKQWVDPGTGAIHESDILDAGTGKIDRGTGNIYVQTAQGPQVIDVDPQQKRLAQIVSQKTQAQAQGSPIAASIASAKSALSDTQRQLDVYQGIPERMNAQIAKYTQASLDPYNTAAADQLQKAQTAFSSWKQQNPRYTALSAKRDALANQIQTQTAAKAQNDLQVAQLLTTPQYVQWNGNTPPSLDATRQDAPAPNGSAPSSGLSIHDLDSRAGVIAFQHGIPAGLAYATALDQAKQQGAQSLDGDPFDNAIQGIQPVAEAQLFTMTPQQLRQAFQSGLITRQQVQTTVMAQRATQDQPSPNTDSAGQQADPVAQSVADLTDQADDLRNKIKTAFDTGGADGAKDLATYRANLADTEGQLHAVTQSLMSRVPDFMQQRIAKAVAPDLDWDAATQQNAQDPIAHFATENLGSALRDQSIAPDLQQSIRQLARFRGINPDLADHVANQAVGANAVRDLMEVIRGRSIDPSRAEILQQMGLLQQSDPNDPNSPLHLTEDAQRLLPPGGQRFVQLKPDMARYTPSPDPAHGSALYQNAVAGMQRFSDTAERMLPPTPSEAEAAAAPDPADASAPPDAESALLPDTTQDTGESAESDSQQEAATSTDSSHEAAPASSASAQPNPSDGSAAPDPNANASTAALAPAISGLEDAPSQQQGNGSHPALANTPQQALQDAAAGKKAYLYDQKRGIQFKPEALADGLKQAVQDGVVNKDWAAQHQQEFQDAQDKYHDLEKAAGSAQVLKALIHGAGPGAAFAAAFPLGAAGGAALGAPAGAWVGGILGAPTGPGEVAAIPAGAAAGSGIGYLLGGLAAGTLAAFAARKGLQDLGKYSDAIKSLNASAQLHPIADATGELATLALNPLSAAERAAGEGFSYAVGAPAAVKSVSNLAKLGAQAATSATELGTSGAMAATKVLGAQLAKAAGAGLIFEGAVRPAFDGAVWVAANTLGIHTDAPQPPSVTSLLQSAALSVLLAGHAPELKEIPTSQVTSAMVRGKVREDLGIPLDSNDPRHIAQVTSYLESNDLPIDSSNAQALTAPLSEGEQHLYDTLSAKTEAARNAGTFGGKIADLTLASGDERANPEGPTQGAARKTLLPNKTGNATNTKQVPPTTVDATGNSVPVNAYGVPSKDFVPKTNIGRYSRPTAAGPTDAQTASVQGKSCAVCGNHAPRMIADHKDALIVEHYRTGTNDIKTQTNEAAVQPHCPACATSQGGQMSVFSKEMKKKLNITPNE